MGKRGQVHKTPLRQLGSAILTFEELYTVLSRIEACLNSRPLGPLSTDPSDLNVLTPDHFLVSGSLTCLPDRDVSNVPTNRLRRRQSVTQLTQQIWRRWSREYMSIRASYRDEPSGNPTKGL